MGQWIFQVFVVFSFTFNFAWADHRYGHVPEWMMSPYSSKETYEASRREIVDQAARDSLAYKKGKQMPLGPVKQSAVQVITVDTRDPVSCYKVKNILRAASPERAHDVGELCRPNSQKPYSSIVLFDSNAYHSGLSQRAKQLAGDTGNLMLFSVALVGFMTFLPESVTKWDDDQRDLSNLLNKYKDNVTRPPVMDEDDAWLNWIAHPYAGAAYYVLARHAGFNQMESFAYSAFVSTFIWEYGVEAFAERPSIQDLIITPVLGSLLGEGFLMLEKSIIENGGKVWGSKTMGDISLVLLDPAGAISRGMNRLTKYNFIDSSRVYIDQSRNYSPRNEYIDSSLMLRFQFNFRN